MSSSDEQAEKTNTPIHGREPIPRSLGRCRPLARSRSASPLAGLRLDYTGDVGRRGAAPTEDNSNFDQLSIHNRRDANAQTSTPERNKDPEIKKKTKSPKEVNSLNDHAFNEMALRPISFAVTPDKYDGKTKKDPQTSLSSFELASTSNFWTDYIKVLRFPCFLTGRSLAWYVAATKRKKTKRLT